MPPITDCTICRKELDHGPVVAHAGGFAHGACLVERQARILAAARAVVEAAEGACGECASCEVGHPERCTARRCE